MSKKQRGVVISMRDSASNTHSQSSTRKIPAQILKNQTVTASIMHSAMPSNFINDCIFNRNFHDSNIAPDSLKANQENKPQSTKQRVIQYDEADENQQNQNDYVIQSMQKRRQANEKSKKEAEKLKLEIKNKTSKTLIDKLKKQRSAKAYHTIDASTKKQNLSKSKKQTVKEVNIVSTKSPKHFINLEQSLKPRPLQFQTNMLDKITLHSPHKRQKKADPVPSTVLQQCPPFVSSAASNLPTQQFIRMENTNSKKLPYRLAL